MAYTLEQWIATISQVHKNTQIMRDLAHGIDSGKALPVGITGAQYEFPMTPQQILDARRDLRAAAKAARDALVTAIQADGA